MSRKKHRKCRGKDTHHIFSQSRWPEFRKSDWNMVEVSKYRHELFHILFANRTPRECIDLLLREFWGGLLDIPIQERRTA